MDNFDLTKFLAEGKLHEAMSPQDVVDIADTVAEEFTKESAEEGDFLIYTVGRMEGEGFELDTDVSAQTPDSIDMRGVGEGWGGIFSIKPTADGYEVRNAEKGGLVAMIDSSGNFRMLSADEARAEMGLEENKEETKSNKMKKSELKEMIRNAFLNETEEKVEEGTWSVLPDRIPEFIKAVEQLKDKYHAVVGSDDVFNGLDNAISAAEELLMNTAEVGDMPGFEGTMDALNSLSIREEEEEDVEVDTEEEVDVDTETADAGEVDVEADAEVEMTGDTKSVQDNLEAALEAAKALGDQKLVDQIGNSITFFTRTHVVGKKDVAEGDIDVEVNNPAEEAEVGMELEEAFGDKEEFGNTSSRAARGLEVKSLAKQLYLGFKEMGAKVRLDANRKKSPIGDEWGEKGLDQLDVLIYVGDSPKGFMAAVDLIGDKAMSFADKIMKDPKFSKFEFNKREIKTWENQKGIELTVYPKVSKKGAVSVTETESLNEEFSRMQKIAGLIK